MGCSSFSGGRLALSRSEAHPRECGNPALGGTLAGIQDAHWHNWGQPRATGTGHLVDGLGYRYPARFTAFGRLRRDGVAFYSRMHLVSKGEERGGAFRPGLNATVAIAPSHLSAESRTRTADRRLVRSTARTRSGAVDGCRASQLTVKLGHSEAAGGTAGANIEFVNRSTHICVVHGWPKLKAETATGSSALARDFPAADFAGFASGGIGGRVGVPRVVIGPGRRADAIFAAADGPGSRPCGQPYRTLRVTPPGTTQSVALSAWIPYLGQFLPSCSQIRLSPALPSADLYKG